MTLKLDDGLSSGVCHDMRIMTVVDSDQKSSRDEKVINFGRDSHSWWTI